MRDLVGNLDHQLRLLAVDPEVYAPPRRSPWWRRLFAGGAGLAALVGTTIALTGPSTANPPILETPTTSAQRLAQEWDGYRRANIDLSKAHVFETPDGPGYAFERRDGSAICIVVPLGDEPGSWGGNCSSMQVARTTGIYGATQVNRALDPNGKGSITLVLPPGASNVVLTLNGKRTPLDASDGVIFRTVEGDGEITFEKDGQVIRHEVSGSFTPDGTIQLDCMNGKPPIVVKVPIRPASATDAALAKARRERCR